MTGTVTGNILDVNLSKTPQIVSIQKQNIVANSLFAINQAEDKEANLKAKEEAIDAYFKSKDMPLFGMGRKMLEESIKNDLDWRLIPALAIRESTGGKFTCKKVTNNPFGWGSCKIGFKSYDEAIETVARNLGGNNPNTAKYYAEKSVDEIINAYNPPSIVPKYLKQVKAIMEDIGEENLGEEKVNS